MKFCPTCQTRYDEEILRFCTKDGTPLVEENEPVFTELPSEKVEAAADDFGEDTVIVRNTPKTEPVEQTRPLATAAPRIVIPTSEPKIEPLPAPPRVRAQTTTVYQSPPRAKSNTGKIVALTLLGTFLILGSVGVLYLMTREQSPQSPNQNVNFNNNLDSPAANFNTNFNIGNSSTFNGVSNSNVSNSNSNANGKTPTPTPKPSPSAPSLSNANNNIGGSTATPTPKPSMSPTPAATSTPIATPTPRPSPTIPPPPPPPPPPPSSRPVNAGVLNGRAVNLPKPAYPPLAKQMRAAGQVAVQVSIDESGNITDAKATSGNIVLRAPAEAAARQSRINPVIIDNRAVKATGVLLYNFAKQ